ncbi:Surfactin synthase thioesterase subunit [Lentzea xinjiangensis]|uniref:Surfactin synthase thioesterase subunit n=1 Tax=Lentzea xinjiangensis TaxID=402600 RepID=A0A1H9IYP8_9PSEU|nr:alpha/beta fold hydrolase [Lentzea xinjiangensis]SEQ79931.1 Surfactin synthase thioesterase subunit [Lentzea xinjiangensis]
MKENGGSRWLVRPRPRPDAALRVVCVPYAGGGASAFWDWAELLGDSVELWCAVLPGRERRFAEPAATEAARIAQPLAEAIRAEVGPPLVLFGHSMGGLLAFDVARRLGDAVEHLFVSAAKAPHLPFGEQPHLFDDDGLVDWMTRLGGVPADLLAHREMLALLLPALRADLTVCAGFHGTTDAIDVPITAFAGTDDPLATVADVAAWQHHTAARFDLVVRPGGHFYLKDDPAAVTNVVRSVAREGVQ